MVFKFSENQKVLDSIGGIKGLEKGLQTDYKNGLTNDVNDINKRKAEYGKNEVRYLIFLPY